MRWVVLILKSSKGLRRLDSWTLDNDDLFWSENFISRNIASNIQVNPGDIFSFSGTGDLLEYAIVDYLDFTPTDVPPPPQSSFETVRFEAEDVNIFSSTHHHIEDLSIASGGKITKADNGDPNTDVVGYGDFTVAGLEGVYDVVVGYFDENDGVSKLRFKQNDTMVTEWYLDQDLGSAEADSSTFVTKTIATGLEINLGDEFRLNGWEDGGEHARVDYIDFVPTAPPTVRVEAEDMTLNTNTKLSG